MTPPDARSLSSSRRERSNTAACRPTRFAASLPRPRRGASSATTSRTASTRSSACAERGRERAAEAVGPPPQQDLLRRALLDRQLAAREHGLLRERELEHAVLVLGDARRLVELRGQREAAERVSVVPLGMQNALAFLPLGFALHFGADRDLVAFDRDLDVVLRDAG